eukprot:2621596-Rhodomonas_salina.4
MRGQTEVSDRHRIAKFVFAGPMDKGRHRTCADSTAERHSLSDPLHSHLQGPSLRSTPSPLWSLTASASVLLAPPASYLPPARQHHIGICTRARNTLLWSSRASAAQIRVRVTPACSHAAVRVNPAVPCPAANHAPGTSKGGKEGGRD